MLKVIERRIQQYIALGLDVSIYSQVLNEYRKRG